MLLFTQCYVFCHSSFKLYSGGSIKKFCCNMCWRKFRTLCSLGKKLLELFQIFLCLNSPHLHFSKSGNVRKPSKGLSLTGLSTLHALMNFWFQQWFKINVLPPKFCKSISLIASYLGLIAYLPGWLSLPFVRTSYTNDTWSVIINFWSVLNRSLPMDSIYELRC